MREIKFRGYNGEKWLFGSLEIGYKAEHACISDNRFWRHPVRFNSVGQFTGLLDNNGKEIYEGDILRFAPPWRWEEDERRNGVVVYKCYGFRIEYSDTSEALFNLIANDAPFTVIGNVYDNPELIKK